MVRLLKFLLKLSSEGFYGDVRIHFRAGVPHHVVEVLATHAAADLPTPDVTSPAYQRILAETLTGVSLPTS